MSKKEKKSYQLCVSGAAGGASVERGKDMAIALGGAIAKGGHQILTGATIGLPDLAAQGAKAAGGISVGISPAASRLAHEKKYRLPTANYDVILYTGLHYIGRDVLLIESSDAVLTLGGRMGTVHEFAVAMEMHKPIGILEGAGGTSEYFDELMNAAGIRDFTAHRVVYDSDPVKLVAKITAILDNDD